MHVICTVKHKMYLNGALSILAAISFGFADSNQIKISSASEQIRTYKQVASFEDSTLRTNYAGLKLELDYQRNLKKKEENRYEGSNLIVLCDDGKNTGLYIGNIGLAAKTLERNLNGPITTLNLRADHDFIDYLLLSKDKIKNVFWYGHGDPFSLWMDLTFKDESCYLDRGDLEELSDAELIKIKSRFTDDAEVKLYTCHAAADSIFSEPISQSISEFFSVGVTGANSWVFARGLRKSNGVDVFFYPATRADYRFHFNTKVPDQFYTGESRWIRFKNGKQLN